MSRDRFPAGGMLHPVPVAGLCLMILNDHWWRWVWPGLVTGKLSDIGVMLFFPLFLQGCVELVQRRPTVPSRRVLIGCTALTAGGFALLQTWPAFARAYAWGVGTLQFPLRWSLGSWNVVRPVQVTMDPTDLLTLPCLGLALWAGWSRTHPDDGVGPGEEP
jgi:hypothetical protein